MRHWRLAIAVAAGLAPGAAPARRARPLPPLPELILDLDAPVIDVAVGDVALRLRVALDAKDVVLLNPAAAARLAIPFADAPSADVGRVTLKTRRGEAVLDIAGRPLATEIVTEDADCCAGVDGEISPAVLPYDIVRLVRRGAAGGVARDFAMADEEETGLFLRWPVAGSAESLIVQFAPGHSETLATAAAGGILANAYGGQFTGMGRTVTGAFGVKRPARTVRFARTVAIAGFTFGQVTTRIADYGRGHAVPAAAAPPDAITVRGRAHRQAAWPQIALGDDLLDRCGVFAFRPATMVLSVTCAAR